LRIKPEIRYRREKKSCCWEGWQAEEAEEDGRRYLREMVDKSGEDEEK